MNEPTPKTSRPSSKQQQVKENGDTNTSSSTNNNNSNTNNNNKSTQLPTVASIANMGGYFRKLKHPSVKTERPAPSSYHVPIVAIHIEFWNLIKRVKQP